MNIEGYDVPKARTLTAFGDEQLETLRGARALHADARVEALLRAGRIYRSQPQLYGVPLEEIAKWSDGDLARAWLSRDEVTAAIDARDHAARLAARLAAVEIATAPAIRLAARIREHLAPYGISI